VASHFYFSEISDSPSVQDRLDNVRAYSRDSTKSLVLGLLDTGMLLVRTARRIDRRKEAHARCLDSAKQCVQRVEMSIWKLREQPNEFSRISSDLERLDCEVTALTGQ
jgi:hypothetical protein